jgi:hypothetical protein
MPLNDEDINEFMRLYKEEFGEEISFADAKARANELLALLLVLEEQPQKPEEDTEK